MPDPKFPIDPSMLSENDKKNFLNMDEQDSSQDTQSWAERTLKAPEGKFASPERRAGKPMGYINIPEAGRYEFFIPDNILESDGMDLIILDEDGTESTCVKLLLNYNDQTGNYSPEYFVKDLPDEFYTNGDLPGIINSYKQEVQQNIGTYVAKRTERSNNHLIRTQHYNDNGKQMDFEQIHQQRAGDCILATTLNIMALNEDGHLPYTISELRQVAIGLRREKGQDYSDIQNPDSPLDKSDFIYLLSTLSGRQPRQENIITVEGQRRTDAQIIDDINKVLDRLASSDYKTIAIGTSYHARGLRYFEDTDSYVLIDPMNRNGIKSMSTEETFRFLLSECRGAVADDNMFYVI